MIVFHNTLAKKKEAFAPLHPGKVGMYVCGPTVYNYIHIGNIRTYVFADTVRRVLEDAGYEVRLIKNITDVGHLTADDIAQGDSGEDKIEQKAKAEKKTPADIAAFFESYFHRTEQAMNILPAHYFPRATAHIPQMIKLIGELIARGHAYEKNGNVFLDVTTFPDYGKLSGNTLENLKVGARLEEHPDKLHPWDFALWLKSPQGHLMHWPSPWSEGYPGWHIECSAMSMEYLGDTLDIHTGGEDNIFPHHEAEIVQSEGVTGKPFVRYFVHTRHILVNGEKMSKSKGNFHTLEDILERGFSPMDLRMLFIGSHYRSQMNFAWEALEQAKKNRERLFATFQRLENEAGKDDASKRYQEERVNTGASPTLESFREIMQDDLNTPSALAFALEYCKTINTALDNNEPIEASASIEAFRKIFFLFGLVREEETVPADVENLAKERETARSNKDFAESDRLRAAIEKHGYRVEDVSGGYRLKKA